MSAGAPTIGGLERITRNNPVHLKVTTVANAPSAAKAGAGAIIYVSNGNAGAACLAVSNGTDWKSVVFGPNISAS